MYPDLSYILHDILGTSPDNAFSVVKTFGLFLVIAILTAAYFFALELKRKDDNGLFLPIQTKVTIGEPASPTSLFLNGLLGFFLGFKFFYIVSDFADFQQDPAGVIFSLKGIDVTMSWIAGLVLAGVFAYIKFAEKKKTMLPKPKEKLVDVKPHERLGDITIVSVLSGIIGAKVFAMIEDLDLVFNGEVTFGYWLSQFFSGSGMAIYGGLIMGFLGGYFYLKYLKIRPLPVLDAVAPALMISYGVGRLGCHFSGDGDWGDPNLAAKPDWIPQFLWSYDYPHNVINESAGSLVENCQWNYCNVLAEPVYPTPLYEFFMVLILFGVLWMLRKRMKTVGLLFFTYLIFNGIERFVIEQIRINDEYNVLGMMLTQAEIIALLLIIAGVIGSFFVLKKGKKEQELKDEVKAATSTTA